MKKNKFNLREKQIKCVLDFLIDKNIFLKFPFYNLFELYQSYLLGFFPVFNEKINKEAFPILYKISDKILKSKCIKKGEINFLSLNPILLEITKDGNVNIYEGNKIKSYINSLNNPEFFGEKIQEFYIKKLDITKHELLIDNAEDYYNTPITFAESGLLIGIDINIPGKIKKEAQGKVYYCPQFIYLLDKKKKIENIKIEAYKNFIKIFIDNFILIGKEYSILTQDFLVQNKNSSVL